LDKDLSKDYRDTTLAKAKKIVAEREQFLDHVTVFLKAWLAEMKGKSQGIVRAAASKEAQQKCIRGMSEEHLEAFQGLYKVLRHTSLAWETQRQPFSRSLLSWAVYEGLLIPRRSTILQMDSNWLLRTKLGEVLTEMSLELGFNLVDFKWWDGISVQPKINLSNPLLTIVPVLNKVETIGTAAARAMAAPSMETHNKKAMKSIIETVMQEGLGSIECNGKKVLDHRVKGALDEFLQVGSYF